MNGIRYFINFDANNQIRWIGIKLGNNTEIYPLIYNNNEEYYNELKRIRDIYLEKLNKNILVDIKNQENVEIKGENWFIAQQNIKIEISPSIEEEIALTNKRILEEKKSKELESKKRELKIKEKEIKQVSQAEEIKQRIKEQKELSKSLNDQYEEIKALIKIQEEKDLELSEKEKTVENLIKEQNELSKSLNKQSEEIKALIKIQEEKDLELSEKEEKIEKKIKDYEIKKEQEELKLKESKEKLKADTLKLKEQKSKLRNESLKNKARKENIKNELEKNRIIIEELDDKKLKLEEDIRSFEALKEEFEAKKENFNLEKKNIEKSIKITSDEREKELIKREKTVSDLEKEYKKEIEETKKEKKSLEEAKLKLIKREKLLEEKQKHYQSELKELGKLKSNLEAKGDSLIALEQELLKEKEKIIQDKIKKETEEKIENNEKTSEKKFDVNEKEKVVQIKNVDQNEENDNYYYILEGRKKYISKEVEQESPAENAKELVEIIKSLDTEERRTKSDMFICDMHEIHDFETNEIITGCCLAKIKLRNVDQNYSHRADRDLYLLQFSGKEKVIDYDTFMELLEENNCFVTMPKFKKRVEERGRAASFEVQIKNKELNVFEDCGDLTLPEAKRIAKNDEYLQFNIYYKSKLEDNIYGISKEEIFKKNKRRGL